MRHDSVEAGGRTRTYTVAGADEGKPGRDLILLFHGSKQTGEAHRKFTGAAYDAALADDGTAVVVYLDGYKKNWNDARLNVSFPARKKDIDDVAFTRAVIEKLTTSHRINPHRVFAVGYSNGGHMVMRLAHETSGLIAGAAVIAATLPTPDNYPLAEAPSTPLPVLIVHGTKDRIVPYGGGEMSRWARAVFKVGGGSLSAPQTAAYFAARNGITGEPVSSRLPQRAGPASGTSAERTDYRQQGRPPVTLLTVHGGGHTIPGPAKAPAVLGRTNQDVNTAELIREFFGPAAAS